VFKDPRWDIEKFNVDTDIAHADKADNDTINALDPDLGAFISRGGRLIQYHGWSDPQISPSTSTAYYRRVLSALAGKADVAASHRLFMAPGMGHCGGGEGPNTFDMLAALERWVEQRQPPDQIPAAHSTNGRVDRTRPLCPYPRVAVYRGSGSTDEAANFVCADR
jgi:feruloyl esterase